MIAISHPTGNANVRNALRALQEAEMLEAFVTTIAAYPDNLFGRLASTRIGAEFSRRGYNPALAPLTRQYPTRELLRLTFNKAGINNLTRHEEGPFCIDKVYRHLDKSMAKRLRQRSPSLQAVYCYEDGALETFREAKKHGLLTLYDLPTGHWRYKIKLLNEECELEPGWACLLPGLDDSLSKCERKDEELALADKVIIASSFVSETLPSEIKPTIIPYGAPVVSPRALSSTCKSKLRVLYVGSLSQQKGISYLFKSLHLLGNQIELTIIGRRPNLHCKPLNSELNKCRYYPSLCNKKVLDLMEDQDVFVFPTLFDGFGLVILEALSRGLPVITTTNCGGPSVITEGEDGFIVPIRDPESIATKLELLYSDRDRLHYMKEAAIKKALSLTWNFYRNRLVEAVTTSIL